MDPHSSQSAGASDWITAVTLGGQTHVIPTDLVGRALEQLREARGQDLAADVVSAWTGVPAETLGTLLVRSREGASALPTLVLGGGEGATLAPGELPAHVPRRLGPYDLLSQIGHGGMGIVYKARHAQLGTECAVKVLISGEHASADAISRFRREATAVARMGKHPNIVAVHDLNEQQGIVYYAMELVDGDSLDRLLRDRTFTAQEAASIVERVARAVHFAHGHGVIHRDLKPANVIMRRDGEPQVMDFGLAKDLGRDGGLSMTGDVMGTLGYMSPEQARGDVGATDARTDVYSLGGVLYELLSGVPPHAGQTPAVVLPRILSGEIVPPSRLRAEVPRDLETIALKALSLDAARRYPTAEALADDLARWRRGEPIVARPAGVVERLVRAIRRRPLPAAAAVVAVAALVAGMVLARAQADARRRTEVDSLLREARGASDPDRAIEACWGAIAIDPGNAEARRQLEAAGAARRERNARRARQQAEEEAHGRAKEAAKILSSLPSERREAIEALIRADELLREGERALAAHGGGAIEGRYEANLRLGTLAIEGGDFTLAEIAFSVCRSVDAAHAEAEGLSARVSDARGTEARRRAGRIAEALEDLRKGLARARRPPGAPTVEDYVFEVSGYRDEQTVKLLAEALLPLRAKARREGRGARWSDPERDVVRLAARTLGRLGLPSAVEPLGALLGVVWDHELAVECGIALCNTRSAEATGPLLDARGRLGVNSPAWAAIRPTFARIPDLEGKEPTSWQVYYARGDFRMARGDVKGALADLRRAVELGPKEGRCWVHLGNALQESGDLTQALDAYGKAIEVEPTNGQAWQNRAEAKRNLGDSAGAIADATEAIRLDEGDPSPWLMRGAAQIDLGRMKEAIADLDRAIAIDPKMGEAYMLRGVARRDAPRKAMEDLSRAVLLMPNDPRALVNRGDLKRRTGDFDGALADVTKAIGADPRFAPAYQLRGWMRDVQGDFPGALADLTATLEYGRRTWDVYLARGSLRRRMGNLKESLEDYDEAVRLDPRNAQARCERGAVRYALGERDRAIEDFTATIGLDEKSAPAWLNRGMARLEKGELEAAIADLTKGLELDPGNLNALRHRGNARARSGDLTGAVKDWESFLQIGPSDAAAAEVRTSLESARARLGERK